MIGLGIILILVGIVGAVQSGPMDMEARTAYSTGETEYGTDLKRRADLLHFGGFAVAAIGLVFMTAGLVKNQQARIDRF